MARSDVDVEIRLRVTRKWLAYLVFAWTMLRGRGYEEAIGKASDVGVLEWNLGNGWEPVFGVDEREVNKP